MKKILIIFVLIVQGISIKAEKCTHIRMNNDGTVQTASGTIYRLFQSEMFSVDSTNVLSIFSDRANINSISGSFSTSYGPNYQYDIESKISVRRDDDSLYVRVRRVKDLYVCLLINQNRNSCFARITENQQGTYQSYSLKSIQCDSNSILRIAPIGFYSFVVHWKNIKKVDERIDSTRYTVYELSTIKFSNNDTISLYSTTQKEPYLERIEDRGVSHSSFFMYMVLLLCLFFILFLSATTYFYWRKLSHHKHAYNNEAVEICDEQIEDNRKLQKERSDLSSKLSKLEKKLHDEHIRSMHLENELAILHNTVIEKEKENEALKMEIEKRNDRIYSIENKLKKAEYDNHQLEEKLSQNNALATE